MQGPNATSRQTRRSGKDRRQSANQFPLSFIRLPEVIKLCGLSRSSIYAAINESNFPPPVKLNNARACAWVYGEVVLWMEERIRRSR